MKKAFLLACILSFSSIFADAIEKNGVNFQWDQFGGQIYFVNGGRPYSLKITNNSPHSIEINKSVISAPIVSYQELKNLAGYYINFMIHIRKISLNDFLDAPITIQPGKTVTKIFWLQNPGQLVAGKWGILSNPKGQFSINFDSIKVLK